MAAYDVLARFYDALMPDVDYAQTAQFYQAVFDRFGCAPQIVLDLACGTGALSVELARCGYEVIGCDASESMLAARRGKEAAPWTGYSVFASVDAGIGSVRYGRCGSV